MQLIALCAHGYIEAEADIRPWEDFILASINTLSYPK